MKEIKIPNSSKISQEKRSKIRIENKRKGLMKYHKTFLRTFLKKVIPYKFTLKKMDLLLKISYF